MSSPYQPQGLSMMSHKTCFTCFLSAFLAASASSQTLYEFGNPGPDEQHYIELINRARANPPAEGLRLATTTHPQVTSAYGIFSVNLTMMQSEFNALTARPPLAPNAALTTAARGHTNWLFANQQQTHVQTNPTKELNDRLAEVSYSYSSYGENVFSYAKDTWHGHAGFQVDWGEGPGGMQPDRGHRASIHSGGFQEIGVGVVSGTNGPVGPQLVTQVFGNRTGMMPRGTGVAYYDLNGNNFYDPGEGIQGLNVNVTTSAFFCKTALGGGWVVPTPSATATQTVTFSGLNINQSLQVPFTAAQNTKVDLKLTYQPPSFTSGSSAQAGNVHQIQFTPVGGAASYRFTRWKASTAPAENCENTTNITSSTTGTYQVLNTSIKSQGNGSFNLQNTTGSSQSIQLNSLYRASANPSLTFQSRLGLATSSETFKVQIQEEGSTLWQDAYAQVGNGSSVETSFQLRSANIAAFANKAFRVRFFLSFTSGSRYTSGSGLGWYVDQIQFTNVQVLDQPVTQTLANPSASFVPDPQPYVLGVFPVISGREFPGGFQTLSVSQASGYAAWASTTETTAAIPSGSLANPNHDHDSDGLPNLVEYAFGTSPVIPGQASPRLPSIRSSATHLIVRYQKDTSLTGITMVPQAGDLSGSWRSPGQSGAPSGFADVLISTAAGIETREASFPISSAPRGFIRMKITIP